jgi:RNase P subunit RPR2
MPEEFYCKKCDLYIDIDEVEWTIEQTRGGEIEYPSCPCCGWTLEEITI